MKNLNSCCSKKINLKHSCPKCNEKAKSVLAKTLNALLKEDILKSLETLDGFYYCKTSSCDVVYFKDEKILIQNNLKVGVGLKDGVSPATLCYCFGWTKENLQTNTIEDIKEKMKNPGCSCEVLNPSGACCLADVTKAIKDLTT